VGVLLQGLWRPPLDRANGAPCLVHGTRQHTREAKVRHTHTVAGLVDKNVAARKVAVHHRRRMQVRNARRNLRANLRDGGKRQACAAHEGEQGATSDKLRHDEHSAVVDTHTHEGHDVRVIPDVNLRPVGYVGEAR